MRRFVRKQLTYFLAGFVIAFVLYLFVRFDFDKIILGLVIGAVAGVALCFGVAALERRFPDEPDAPADAKK